MEGLGAVLYQDKPVTVASKTLTNTEQNYSNIEGGMLAIVFALTRFHHYTYGRHVIVESDYKSLESITKKPVSTASPRTKRMLLKIQPLTTLSNTSLVKRCQFLTCSPGHRCQDQKYHN